VTPDNIATYSFAVVSLILLLFAFLVLWKIYIGEIPLDGLLAELPTDGTTKTAKASLSRFQFLIFTFVVAGLFLLLSIEAGTFVQIPQNVLWLLGISGGTYAVSKTISPKKKDDDRKNGGDKKDASGNDQQD
jgi:hypothetical protein